MMIEAKIERIGGQPAAGFYQLTVSVQVKLNPYGMGAVALVRYDGELQAKGRGGGPLPVGRLVPAGAPHSLTANGHPVETTVHLSLDLDQRGLQAIEELRQGGDLTLTLWLWCLVQDKNGLRCQNSNQPTEFEVNQSAWAKLREQIGARRTILLEIPEPDAQQAPELARAVSLLGEVWHDYQRGDDRDTVGKCRPLLEALSEGLGDPDDKHVEGICAKEVEALFDGVRVMDKTERFRLIRRAIKVACGIALHEKGVGSQINWDRRDAFACLVMSAALLHRSLPDR